MAEINGQIESLSRLFEEFKKNHILGFSTLGDIIQFEKNYAVIICQLSQKVENELELEIDELKNTIKSSLENYNNKIKDQESILNREKIEVKRKIDECTNAASNIFKKMYFSYIRIKLNKRKNVLDTHFDEEKLRPFINLEKQINFLRSKIDYFEKNRNKKIDKRVENLSKRENTAKAIIDENYSTYLGAIGEQKTLDGLRKLPDSFMVINDFRLSFKRPLKDKATGEFIYSIQADHIVIGPSGIFLVETKNWSKESVENGDFYSPVKQIKRTNYALFCYLNRSIVGGYLPSFQSHWGDQKITLRNIITMVNTKPNKEFQYVKILRLSELLGYINYFKPIFDTNQVEELKRFMVY